MVTLNMESRSPMGRVNAENRSRTQKPLGFKGLNTYIAHFNMLMIKCALQYCLCTVTGDFARLLTQFTINVKCDTGAPVT